MTGDVEQKRGSRFWRRTVWVAFTGLVVLCGWCSLLSGAGGWLMGYDVGKREIKGLYLPEQGILVTRVERGSPADEAGISRGDMIVAINGVQVDDVTALQDELSSYRPGEHVMLTYRHDNGESIASVKLERYPDKNIPYLGIYYTARAEAPADI